MPSHRRRGHSLLRRRCTAEQCSLCLMHQAYTEQCPATEEEGTPCFEEGAQQSSVHFDYWLEVLSLEILLLLYVRSLQEGDLDLYVQSLAQIKPRMCPLDHTHYSQQLPVHIILLVKHPNILAEFCAGKCVGYETSNKFSVMAYDQCHEQNSRVSFKGETLGTFLPPPPTLEIVLLIFITDVDKCLTKCMSSESMHM